MTTKAYVNFIISKLKELYPQADCSLTYKHAYQLLFSVRLAAQCTDARVNIVTEELYSKFPTLQSFADADVEAIEAVVKPCGLFRTKARDIKLCAIDLINRFDGNVPDNMEELLSLPGVGRKTANLILGDVYNKPAIVADTHCIRLANRMGLANSKDPKKVEFQLKEIIPPAEQNMLCHRFVWHGRAVCSARSPKCDSCILVSQCKGAYK